MVECPKIKNSRSSCMTWGGKINQLGPSNIRCLVSLKPDVVTITIEWRCNTKKLFWINCVAIKAFQNNDAYQNHGLVRWKHQDRFQSNTILRRPPSWNFPQSSFQDEKSPLSFPGSLQKPSRSMETRKQLWIQDGESYEWRNRWLTCWWSPLSLYKMKSKHFVVLTLSCSICTKTLVSLLDFV